MRYDAPEAPEVALRVGSVSVLAAVELEDPAGERDRAEADADDQQPPRAQRHAVHDDGQRGATPQGPPGVRREEAQLAGPIGDLGVLQVLRARLQLGRL